MTSFAEFAVGHGLVRVPAPEGVECWTGTVGVDGRTIVSLVAQPPASTADFDLTFVDGVLNELPPRLSSAAEAVIVALGDVQGADTPAEWAPEVTFFPGQEWTVRFADVPREDLQELGVLVFLHGRSVTSVSDLSDVEETDEP